MTQQEGKEKQKSRAKRNKPKMRTTVWIGGDQETAEKLQEVEGRRSKLQNLVDVRGEDSNRDRQLLDTLAAEADSLKTKLRESAVAYVFESIGHKRYQKLVDEHPPTDEQVAEAAKEDRAIGFNVETFPYALIDACCVVPEYEEGELEEWLRDDPDGEWNDAEIADLFQAATFVNNNRNRFDLGKG